MKTRIIRTNFWRSGSVLRLSKEAKFLQIYLLTSEYIGLCGIFELPDTMISFETGLTEGELTLAKDFLERAQKVYFYNDWIWIVNHDKHNPYYKSPLSGKAYKKEFSLIPANIKKYFSEKANQLDTTIYTTIDTTIEKESQAQTDSSIDTTMDSRHNTKIINNKKETINNKTDSEALKKAREVADRLRPLGTQKRENSAI